MQNAVVFQTFGIASRVLHRGGAPAEGGAFQPLSYLQTYIAGVTSNVRLPLHLPLQPMALRVG